jgi:2-keto-4-pentenoate hydratase/2-oxohepta-3-ene-1,7-dioic acid hydratase in catechol pathway
MRFVRYRSRDGVGDYLGRLDGDQIIGAVPVVTPLAPTAALWGMLANLVEPVTPMDDVHLLAPVAPGKIVCVGLNYADHAAEGGNALPESPLLFAKWPSSLIGPYDPIVLPPFEADPDFEVELAVVVGRRCKNLASIDEGWNAIGGFTVINDVSGRQTQMGDGQWVRGKGFDTFAPIGPCVVSIEEINAEDVRLGCAVDGHVYQDSSTSELVFNVGQIVAYCSWQCTLEPGDVIATGTPAGVGYTRNPRIRLESGQTLETWVEGIGTLMNPVVQGQDPAGALDSILGSKAGPATSG